MDKKQLAISILELVGGKENVNSLTHCATRLRFELKDESIAQTEKLKTVAGVMGVVQNGGQYQVIIGPDVPNVYAPLVEVAGLANDDHTPVDEADSHKTFVEKLMAIISGIFTPILPVITAAGMIKAVLSLLVVFGVVTTTDQNYQILNFIGDAAFYFLPVFLGGTSC